MGILFKHNFSNLTANRHSRDAIKVEGFDRHLFLVGFVDKRKIAPGVPRVKLISNGWCNNFLSPWTYLAGGEYIEGALIDDDVVVTEWWWG
ncbi:hypothetical protein [uncultured Pseudoteredinibacter sp.]|uniref:hypothetical protein n=1 Tax=uncultured Pseudoteredinibacter sp. TaxID=1641701 RepID=UPI00260D47C7|nr:hypothetical protein [uncultured Pseudoteredinibacter sp.]